MFRRIAVVNRGEPALRLIRAVRELNDEHGYRIKVVALHTESERHAMFVRHADEAVVLRVMGPGNPYLDHGEIARALRSSHADAAWVGWGFVADDPAFAELLAEQVGVPVAPWSAGPVENVTDARKHATSTGYPLMVKARSGGGGRGIRAVRTAHEFESALESAQGEAARTFGDSVIFLEHLFEGGRRVEVQVIAVQQGTVWAPGVRDGSVQRHNQKPGDNFEVVESDRVAFPPAGDSDPIDARGTFTPSCVRSTRHVRDCLRASGSGCAASCCTTGLPSSSQARLWTRLSTTFSLRNKGLPPNSPPSRIGAVERGMERTVGP